MSVPNSIKLLKLSTCSNSHIKSRRLSAVVVNLTANKFNQAKSNDQLKNLKNKQYTNEQYKEDVQKADGDLKLIKLTKEQNKFSPIESPTASFLANQNLSSSNDLKMGSSNSKCTKITDQPSNCSNNGWQNAKHSYQNNLPPQLNQPYLHHSCSMINLTDCVCCHSLNHDRK